MFSEPLLVDDRSANPMISNGLLEHERKALALEIAPNYDRRVALHKLYCSMVGLLTHSVEHGLTRPRMDGSWRTMELWVQACP